MKNLESRVGKAIYIKIEDRELYDPQKCRNGGGYLFKTVYIRDNPHEDFEVSHYTSAEIPFCERRGDFQTCRDCLYMEREGVCKKRFKKISEKKLKEIIKTNKKEEHISILIY